MTEAQIGAKRHDHNMSRREKRRARLRRIGLGEQASAARRQRSVDWLAGLGLEQLKNQKAMDDAHRQAQESRRTKLAIAGQPQKGLMARFKAFFRGR